MNTSGERKTSSRSRRAIYACLFFTDTTIVAAVVAAASSWPMMSVVPALSSVTCSRFARSNRVTYVCLFFNGNYD
jgi:membrane protein YqaA with SNARE-associated domain